MFNAHSNSGAPRARERSPIPKKCGNLPIREILVNTWPYVRPTVHTNDVRKVKERVCNIEWSFLCPQMQLWLTLKPKIGKNKKKPQYSKPIFSVRDSGFQKFLLEESGIQKPPAKNPWLTAWNLESNTVLDSLSWGSWGESFYFHNKYLNKGALPDSGCHLNLDLVASFHSFQITGNLEARQGTVIFAWLRKKTNVSYRSKRQQRSKFKSGYCDWHSKLKAVKGRETGCQWNAGSKSIFFF